jgi:hypothetical protein
MSSEEASVRLRRNLRLEPSEAPENVRRNHHSLRSATVPGAINRRTPLAESRGGRPLLSHLCVPRPLAGCLPTPLYPRLANREACRDSLAPPMQTAGHRRRAPAPLRLPVPGPTDDTAASDRLG